MSSLIKQQWRLVVEQRGDDPMAIDRKPYRTVYFPKTSEEKAIKGLADWEENKARILGTEADYIVNWTAYIEHRLVTEGPWERPEA